MPVLRPDLRCDPETGVIRWLSPRLESRGSLLSADPGGRLSIRRPLSSNLKTFTCFSPAFYRNFIRLTQFLRPILALKRPIDSRRLWHRFLERQTLTCFGGICFRKIQPMGVGAFSRIMSRAKREAGELFKRQVYDSFANKKMGCFFRRF